MSHHPLLALIRPHHWLKNSFVFLPLFFSGHLFHFSLLLTTVIVFFSFSFAASSIYCFNDLKDAETDRKHPRKKHRPIAAGKISKPAALLIMLTMIALSMLLAWLWGGEYRYELMGIVGFYYLMNMAYCVVLKNIPLIDIMIVSLGFVLRIVAGGVATAIELSHWIIIMTYLLALFLAMAKRRDDVILYEQKGEKMRKNISCYNKEFIDLCIAIMGCIVIISYIMYTISAPVIQRLGTEYLYTTAFFVVLGIFRYMQLTIVFNVSGNPTKILIKDHYIQFSILGWMLAFVLLIYYF